MATNAVRWLRDYLAARDLSEVAGGLAVEHLAAHGALTGGSDIDHLSAKPLPLERLSAPLPPGVRRAATASLIVFGVLCCSGALFVVGGAVAVVLMPILMGREGVGTAMITLFAVCVTFVLSGILLLAARSAARVIRRERRGVRSLFSFSVAAVLILAFAAAITQWLSVAFFASSDVEPATINWATPLRGFEFVGVMTFVWIAFVMSRYDRELLNKIR